MLSCPENSSLNICAPFAHGLHRLLSAALVVTPKTGQPGKERLVPYTPDVARMSSSLILLVQVPMARSEVSQQNKSKQKVPDTLRWCLLARLVSSTESSFTASKKAQCWSCVESGGFLAAIAVALSHWCIG